MLSNKLQPEQDHTLPALLLMLNCICAAQLLISVTLTLVLSTFSLAVADRGKIDLCELKMLPSQGWGLVINVVRMTD